MALINSYGTNLYANGCWERLSNLLSTDSVERTAALGSGVKQYTTLADVPVGFSGTAQVGTDLYVGDGGAAVAVGGASIANAPSSASKRPATDTMVGAPTFSVNDKYNYYKTVPAMSVASSEKCMFAYQNTSGLFYSFDGKFWKQGTAFSPFAYTTINPLTNDYIVCDYGTNSPSIISMANSSTNLLKIGSTTTTTITTVTLPVTTTFYKPVFISGGVALIVPNISTNQIYILYNNTTPTISTITLPYTAIWQQPTALYEEEGVSAGLNNTNIALLTDGTHLVKVLGDGTTTELTGISGSIINIAATRTNILVETNTTAFIASYIDIYNSTGIVNWVSPVSGYSVYGGGNYYIISNATYFVRIGLIVEDFLNISKDGLQWRIIKRWPRFGDQATLREGQFLSNYGFVPHCNAGHVLYDFETGVHNKLSLSGWPMACHGSKVLMNGGSIIDIEGMVVPIPTKVTTGTATTGATITLTENCTNHIVITTGLLDSLSITMPPSPYHSQTVIITLMCTVTTFSLTVNAAPASQSFAVTPLTGISTAGTVLKYIYNSTNKIWYPC